MEAFTPRNSQERTWAIIDAVKKVAEKHNASMAQVSLAWLSKRPAVTSVLVGARNQTQLADNLGAADISLAKEDMELLSAISAPEHNVYPYGDQADQQRHREISGGR